MFSDGTIAFRWLRGGLSFAGGEDVNMTDLCWGMGIAGVPATVEWLDGAHA